MSLISRLLGNESPPAPSPAAEPQPVAAPAPPRPDPQVLAREDDERLAAAIASGSPAALTDCVLNAHSTKARQRAARHVEDPEHLRELIRLTRGGNDNSVYRILTAKRDALSAADRAREARRTAIESLIAGLARRSRLPYDALYEPSLTMYRQDWAGLAADATPEETGQVAGLFATMQAVIAQHHRDIAAAAERARAAAEAEASAAAAAAAAAEAASVAAPVEAIVEPEPPLQQLPEPSESRDARRADAAQPLIALLRRAQAALDQGGTARAQRLRATLAAKLAEPVTLPAWFDRQLQQLDAKLAELRDWKTFTVVPKRAELVQRMQALIGAGISPEELANHVRRLQDEWRTLNRGAGDDGSAETAAFREAAQRAYEPCREHFARQAALRQANREARESILTRLAAYAATLDGDGVNWRHVAQTIAEARREWREHAPVDNAVAAALQERLRGALGDLQRRLDSEYARNVAARRDLIGRAQQLTALTDTREAIDGAKLLQRAWRDVGPVPRERSDALWNEFRGHCDAIFQRSAQQAAAHGATLDANRARAEALCEELERAATLQGDELHGAVQALEERRAQFDALELPRSVARSLRERFTRAAGRCADAVRAERGAAARRAASALFDAAGAIRGYALAQLQSGDVESARSAAAAAVAALAGAPKAARATLEQQFAKVASGAFSPDLAVNEAALRLLCIRAELATDQPTPAEDLGLRRDYQMRRLMESRGLGGGIALAGPVELSSEWFTAGPVDPAVETGLRARFERCRDAAGARRTNT